MTKFAAFRARLFVSPKNAVMRRRLHHASLVSVTDFALFAADVFRGGKGQGRGHLLAVHRLCCAYQQLRSWWQRTITI